MTKEEYEKMWATPSCPRCGSTKTGVGCIKRLFGTTPAFVCFICGHKWPWPGGKRFQA